MVASQKVRGVEYRALIEVYAYALNCLWLTGVLVEFSRFTTLMQIPKKSTIAYLKNSKIQKLAIS